jgi:hypothetical protein
MMMLPAPPGTCPECAVDHDPSSPHDQQSLHWQYHFYIEHGRWPTWADAIAHCADDVKQAWTETLAELGIDVDDKNPPAGSPSDKG